jgi:hypothetical protein
MDEVTGRWRKFLSEELHNFYSSVNIVRVIKSRRISWGYVAHMVDMGNIRTKFWSENLKVRDNFGDQDVNGEIILKWILSE